MMGYETNHLLGGEDGHLASGREKVRTSSVARRFLASGRERVMRYEMNHLLGGEDNEIRNKGGTDLLGGEEKWE